MEKGGAVYILANKCNTVLYTGVTFDLIRRVTQHKDDVFPKSFTSKYKVKCLVYFEPFHSIVEAILREKQIKKLSRTEKVRLIEKVNPECNDFYNDIIQW